ncbi:MAG: AI-2E family transporter, partial [Arenibacter algicola]|nr:AI-2E family transporter [Arenibacter algicola]
MNELRTTNKLLLIIVIPLVFYLLKLLSFIFIPLIFSMFIALLFLPIMRWLNKKNVSKPISIFIVILIFIGALKIGGELIQLTSKEILSADNAFFQKAETKLEALLLGMEDYLGIPYAQEENIINNFIPKESMMKNFGTTLDFIGNTVTMILMTVFFVVLWLAESINVQKLMNNTILKQKHTSV